MQPSESLVAYRSAMLLHAAAKLGLFQALDDTPRPLTDLAQVCGVAPAPLERVLRGLVFYGFAVQTAARMFSASNTVGELRDEGSSLFAEVLALGDEDIPAWCRLEAGVRSGTPPFEVAFGEEFFAYIGRDAARLTRHTRIMSSMTAQLAGEVAAAFDFSCCHRIVDVGGGGGEVLRAILQRYPRCHGVLFDTPDVLRIVTAAGSVASNLELEGGDFFRSVPVGGDLYFLKWILHDWSDDESAAILKNCHRAGGVGARLMICERLSPVVATPGDNALQSDLTMFVFHRGRERTLGEFRALLTLARFDLDATVPLPSGRHLLLATAV